MTPITLFLCGIILSAAGVLSPPMALVAGVVFAFLVTHPLQHESHTAAKFLLQAAVVLLGFGMDLREVLRVGRAGVLYTAIGICVTLLLGWGLGRLMRVSGKASFLITCGTAICGGSAIAAIAPVISAGEEDIAVSLGTVFTLNAVALLAFPLIGWRLGLSQIQFGLWSALAIHDTSSVVGAASRYGAQALAIGVTVKLARALWIIPVALVASAVTNRRAKPQNAERGKIAIPWFIGLFVLAAIARTLLPRFGDAFARMNALGRSSLTVVLFLIGTGLSREALRRAGVRPMLQGVLLWLVAASASLLAIRAGWIHL